MFHAPAAHGRPATSEHGCESSALCFWMWVCFCVCRPSHLARLHLRCPEHVLVISVIQFFKNIYTQICVRQSETVASYLVWMYQHSVPALLISIVVEHAKASLLEGLWFYLYPGRSCRGERRGCCERKRTAHDVLKCLFAQNSTFCRCVHCSRFPSTAQELIMNNCVILKPSAVHYC